MHENLVENGESDCEGICAPHKAGAAAVGCRAFATRQFTSATVFQLVDPTICPKLDNQLVDAVVPALWSEKALACAALAHPLPLCVLSPRLPSSPVGSYLVCRS